MFETNLSLLQLVLKGLDGVLQLLDLGSAVLQLGLEQVGGLFVRGQSAVSLEQILVQLLLFYIQKLKSRARIFPPVLTGRSGLLQTWVWLLPALCPQPVAA